MSEQTIQCPICSQEFPQYDQRGFRNAGFTAHHKWCVSRQQQNEVQQQEQQSTRASRFALTIRRRSLPASQVDAPANEGQSKISSMPVFPRSSSASVDSVSSGASRTESSNSPIDRSTTLLQHQQFQQQHRQQHQHPRQPILRQRHTWNHWNIPRTTSRRISVNAMSPPTGIVPSTSAPTPPTFLNLQMDSSSRALDPDIDVSSSSAYSLLKTSTADSGAGVWPASQVSHPLLSSPSSSSPMVTNNNTAFSFTSMTTTLPLAYSSRNTSINTSYIDSTGIQSPPAMCPTDQYVSSDLTPSYLLTEQHSISTQQQQHYYGHRPQPSYQQLHDGHDYQQHDMPPFMTNNLTWSQTDSGFFRQQVFNTPSPETGTADTTTTTTTTMDIPGTSLSPSASASTTVLPSSDLHHYQLNTLYCGYCQPRDGFHDPSCSLLQFFMTNIMDGNENTFSSI